MTKAEVLNELDALIELTNESGKGSIRNIRAWVESKSEAEPVVGWPEVGSYPIDPFVAGPSLPVKRAVKKVVKRK